MGDGFYRRQFLWETVFTVFTGLFSKDPTNSIKVLKAHIDYTINRKAQSAYINRKHSKSPSLY